ncbi:hypothetical protein ES708_06809 [subsurface metagenome]
MLEKEKLNIVFLWHWQKRLTREKNAVFAVPDFLINIIGKLFSEYSLKLVIQGKRPIFAVTDSLIGAIGKLSLKYYVKLVALSKKRNYNVYSPEQNIDYIFRKSLKDIVSVTKKIDPDFIFINHHPMPYKELQEKIDQLRAKKFIYYSASIKEINDYHRRLDGHIVHHEYQKDILKKKGIDTEKIFVAPKTADMKVFKPVALEKKWDCIYPMRGGIGYLKRPELAIEACRINNMSIVMPGAKIPPEYHWVTTFDNWKLPEELAELYNQSKCLVITTDDMEMGPRVIPEAAACNIPIVCCEDSRACASHVKKIGGFIAKPNPMDISEKIKLAIKTKTNTRQRLLEIGYDYDLMYREISKLVKNEVNNIVRSEKNKQEKWDILYKENKKRWQTDWRLNLYNWVLEDIHENRCSIIDIGAGPGYGLQRIKNLRPDVDVCAVDFSEEAKKISVVPFIKKDVICDDISNLKADYLLCIETLEHFKNPFYVLNRILRITIKKLILTVPYKENIENHTQHHYVFNKKSFEDYPVQKIEIRKRSKGKIMKVVINVKKFTVM